MCLCCWGYQAGGLGELAASADPKHNVGPTPRGTFDKLAGIDEVKDEVVEIVDFLPWAAGYLPSP